jgi:hypothetical protein
MTRFHSPEELAAFWEPEDIPHGPAAASWESPTVTAKRYRDALNDILVIRTDQPHALLLQSLAAKALGDDALSDRLFARSLGEA